ncbi:hypothetical protein [Emcibacter sp. SYSU 3D8]|uniref:hypothetical protein n=1 Tax=Emcibacter sp. SYSU 3D8 TaxID=3133969 RepID=UPI0031FF2CA1
MNLLFKRDQTSMPRFVRFKLWSKIDLEQSELAILNRYALDKAILVDIFQPNLLRNAILVGIGAAVAAYLLLGAMDVGSSLKIILVLVAAGGAGWFHYDRKRETVFVRDLIHGRHFSCDSVIDLARREAWLKTITGYLRDVMESAKNWDGTETIPIPASDPDRAKLLMIKGP